MLSPVFFGTSFMFVQLGLYELYAGSLSYATQTAARQILIGKVANGTQVNINTFITNFVCPNLPPPMNCNNVIVNAQVMTENTSGPSSWWSLMNSIQTGLAPVQMDNKKTSFCIGQPGATVALEIYYPMPVLATPLFPLPTTQYNGSSVIWLTSTAAFRNEPFGTAYSGC